MTIIIFNQANDRIDTLTSLNVNMAYKEGKKDNLMYGIFNNKDAHEPTDAYALYSTKKRAKEVIKEIMMDLYKEHYSIVKEPAVTLSNGYIKSYKDVKYPLQVYIITFPKE